MKLPCRIPVLVFFALTVAALLRCGDSSEDNLFSLFQRGVSQADRFEFDRASATFAQIGQTDPASPLSYLGSGIIFEHRLRFYDAMHVYMSLNRSHPTFAPAYRAACRMYLRFGESADAVSVAGEYARLLESDADAHLLFAEALMAIEQYGRARQEVDSARVLGADEVTATLLTARTFAGEHEGDSAGIYLDRARAGRIREPIQLAHAAAYYETCGLIDSAILYGREAIDRSEDFSLMLQHFFRALRHRYFYEAGRLIHGLQERDAPPDVISGLQVHLALAENDMTTARHAVQAYSAATSMSIDALVYDSKVWGRITDWMSVSKNHMAIMRMAQQENYDSLFQAFLYYRSAILAGRYFDDFSPIDILENVPSRYAARREIVIPLARCYFRARQDNQFERRMEDIARYHSRQKDWLARLADVYGYRRIRQYDRADSLYRQALAIDRWYQPALDSAVAMYRRSDQTERALQFFESYPHLETQYPAAALLKALCLVETDHVDAGFRLFVDAFPSVRGDLIVFGRMTRLLARRQADDKLQSLHELLVSLSDENADALVLAAKYYTEVNNFERALSLCEQALDIAPGNYDASAYWANARYHLGERSEAIEIFERNLDSAHFSVANNYLYSRILAAEQVEPKKAANLARRAVNDSGHDLEIWMNLSYVYYQTGRYDLAMGEALKASVTYDDDPEPYYRAGMAMYKLGKDETRENLEKALALGLSGPFLAEAQRTLEQVQ